MYIAAAASAGRLACFFVHIAHSIDYFSIAICGGILLAAPVYQEWALSGQKTDYLNLLSLRYHIYP
ncbi:MAG: hypothetical protein ABIT83_02780 [Massilia sp.]